MVNKIVVFILIGFFYLFVKFLSTERSDRVSFAYVELGCL